LIKRFGGMTCAIQEHMKIKNAGVLLLAAGGMILLAGCVVRPDGRVAFEPVVVAAPPPVVVDAPPVVVDTPPAVVETDVVPDDYVWDGYEYVGVVGDSYFYLGPGNVWLVCDPVRLGRFHGWERGHADWRVHAIRNERFRADAHGHVHARVEHRGDHH
jgi:hypothetical protein